MQHALIRLLKLVLGLVLLWVFVSLLLPAGSHGPPPRRAKCHNNLEQIALAVLNYENEYGSLPPPYISDSNGVPLLSWRVLILPYLEHADLYAQVNLNKPWNHPDNLRLADSMPEVYICPRWRDNKTIANRTTPYVAICGDDTAWPRRGCRKIAEITDGTSNTLMVLQSEPSRLPWMAPFDPGIEAIGAVAVDRTSGKFGDSLLRYEDGLDPILLFCDGHTRSVSDSLSADTFHAICTVNGGEEVADQSAY